MWASLYIIVCVRSASRGVYNLLGETIEIDATSPCCASIWVIVIEQGCEHAVTCHTAPARLIFWHNVPDGNASKCASNPGILYITCRDVLFAQDQNPFLKHVDEKLNTFQRKPPFSVFCYSLSSPLSYVASYWHAAPSHHFYIHPGTWWFQSGSKAAVIVRMKLRNEAHLLIIYAFVFPRFLSIYMYTITPCARASSRACIYISNCPVRARAPLLLLRMVRGYSDVLR